MIEGVHRATFVTGPNIHFTITYVIEGVHRATFVTTSMGWRWRGGSVIEGEGKAGTPAG